jgi:hypothetical protein
MIPHGGHEAGVARSQADGVAVGRFFDVARRVFAWWVLVFCVLLLSVAVGGAVGGATGGVADGVGTVGAGE